MEIVQSLYSIKTSRNCMFMNKCSPNYAESVFEKFFNKYIPVHILCKQGPSTCATGITEEQHELI